MEIVVVIPAFFKSGSGMGTYDIIGTVFRTILPVAGPCAIPPGYDHGTGTVASFELCPVVASTFHRGLCLY